MSFRDQLTRGVLQLHDTVGREVDLVNATNPTRDPDHNDIRWTDEDRTTVKGEVVESGTPEFERLASGVDSNVDAMIYVPSQAAYGAAYGTDYGAPLTTGSGDQTTPATCIEVDGITFVVRETIPTGTGRTRCHCVKES